MTDTKKNDGLDLLNRLLQHLKSGGAGDGADASGGIPGPWAPLLRDIPMVFYAGRLDGNFHFEFINDHVEDLTGYPAADWMSDPGLWERTVAETDRRRVADAFFRNRSMKGPIQLDYRLAARNGREVWIRNVAAAEADGAVVRVIGGWIDITASKQLEGILERGKRDWELTFDTVPDLIALLDEEYRVVRANRAFARRAGRTPADMIGLSCHGLMHQCPEPPPDCPFTRILRTGGEHACEQFIRKLGGYFSISVTPILDGEGRFRGAVHVARDITELKRTQEALVRARDELEDRVASRTAELARANQALQQEIEERKKTEAELAGRQANWMSVVEKSSDALLVVDLDGAVRYANRTVETLLGWPPADLVGRPFPYPLLSHPANIPLPRAEGEPGRTAELRTVETRWEGQSAWLVSMRDVTARIMLEEQLRQALKMEAIGRLAGGVAHDFNNLLTSVMGFAKLAYDALDEDNPARNDLREVLNSGNRAARLVSQLLQFGRKQGIQMAPLDLNDVILNLDPLLRRSLGSDIEWVTLLGDNLHAIVGDRSCLEQAILNLCLNARDAMPDGGKIYLETANLLITDEDHPPVGIHPGDYVVLKVRDTGAGMSEEVRVRIFEPYFTTKAKGKGTGLGLSQVYTIVREHRGDVSVHSEIGAGTEFALYFPRAVSPAPARPAGEPAGARTAPRLPGGREAILVVEDEDTVRNLVVRMLSGLGYKVWSSRNGMEALEWLERHDGPLDLVVSDIVMPRMSGIETVARLRALRSGIKVLYCSGFTGENFSGDLKGEKFEFLRKPFTRDCLATMVRRILDEKRTPD